MCSDIVYPKRDSKAAALFSRLLEKSSQSFALLSDAFIPRGAKRRFDLYIMKDIFVSVVRRFS